MKSPEIQADILLQSREVKRFLLERCSLLQVDIRDVAKHCKVPEHNLTMWTNGVLPEEVLESMLARAGDEYAVKP